MAVTAKRRSAASGATVLLAFTGAGVAVAQPPPGETPPQMPQVEHRNWVDDPYSPHVTDGTLLRFGTAVGPMTVDQRKYTALGAVIALGRRVGRFSFDLEYDYLGLQDPGPSSLVYARAQNLDLVGRLEVLRLGPTVVGANSMVAFYVEGALQRTMYHYYLPAYGDAPRPVAEDNARSQAAVGFGTLLDHRLEQPLGFPNRIGWQLGWRLATSPRDQHDVMKLCRGCDATMAPVMTSRVYDTELIVTSTLDFTW
jgi:hypothetical protein